MMKKLCLALTLTMASLVLFAKTNTWTSAVMAGHWGDAGAWGGQSIEEGDFVLVPADATAKIADADIETVNKLKAILTPARTSTVEFDVEGECEVVCVINRGGFAGTASEAPAGVPAADRSSGRIVKNGKGCLWLNNGDGLYAYLTASIDVNDGVLRLPCVSYSRRNMNFGKITVNDPGVLYPTSWNGEGASADVTFWCQLAGDGVVSNPAPTHVIFFPVCDSYAAAADFSGRFVGRVYSYGGGTSRYQNFSGTGSDNPEDLSFENNTVYGLADLGGISADMSQTNRGSFGYGDLVFSGTPTLRYLGTGGVSYATLRNSNSILLDRPTIDGGETGGLRLLGGILFSQYSHSRLCLTGNHTNDCSFEGQFQLPGANSAVFVTKSGSGTWSFLGRREHNGVFAVEDGTLKFDSLEATGRASALGLSSVLRENKTGSVNGTEPVDYAFLLGSANKTGTMDYVGVGTAVCADRKIALRGNGALRASRGGLILGGGVTTESAGAHTLTLGETAAPSVVNGIVEGADAPVKVVKEGTGVWTLGGDQAFTGGLEVRGGTVRIGDTTEALNRYTYYRFVMENKAGKVKWGEGASKTCFFVGRLGFFNAKGVVQTSGLVFNDAAKNNPTKLGPGEYSYEIGKYSISGHDFSNPDEIYCKEGCGSENLFDSDVAHADTYMEMRHKKGDDWTTWWPSTQKDGDQTVTIVLRLPLEAEAVTSYDVGQHVAWDGLKASASLEGASNLGEWHIEASVDGTTWETVSTVKVNETYLGARAGNHWLKTNTSYATADGWQNHTTGWTIPSARTVTPAPATRFANGVNGVSVSGGGTLVTTEDLTINSLSVDQDAADKSGTIDGFAFAGGGTIAVTGSDAKIQALKLPITFANSKNLTNLNGWSVTYNGRAVGTVRVSVTADGLEFVKTGLAILIR